MNYGQNVYGLFLQTLGLSSPSHKSQKHVHFEL